MDKLVRKLKTFLKCYFIIASALFLIGAVLFWKLPLFFFVVYTIVFMGNSFGLAGVLLNRKHGGIRLRNMYKRMFAKEKITKLEYLVLMKLSHVRVNTEYKFSSDDRPNWSNHEFPKGKKIDLTYYNNTGGSRLIDM